MNKGILHGIGAYTLWGFFPIYWKLLHHVPALELLSHRIVWSYLLMMGIIIASRGGAEFRKLLNARVIGIYFIAAMLIGGNWGMYVWAVNAGHIVETSLGYFINPLVSVVLGLVILREKLRPMQWVPILLALIGVVYLTVTFGRLPWIALTLAFTFGFYGLVKKLAPLSSLYGLTLETGLLFMPALAFLGVMQVTGDGAFLHTGISSDLLMVGAGVVTTIPLLLFSSAAKQIPLTMIGVLQYFAPTIQFLIGVFVYDEPFDMTRLFGFGLVWLALIIFGVESYLAHRTPQALIPEPGEG
ncbi:MAG: EamA family transporter RarD [Anaerolineales bacterium]|nr:EamA family transporter RarD [Anaerolineales bacterium]